MAACSPQAEREGDFDVVVHDAPTSVVRPTDGDSLTGEDGTSYRLLGINAPDAPECLAEEAAERLRSLVVNPVNVLGDVDDQFGRRLVDVYRPEGSPSWVNLAMVREGLAIALHADDADTSMLFDAQDLAREEMIGLWDPHACGEGPLASIEIIDIEADPPGRDEEVLDEEWVALSNRGDEAVDLTGWTIRDESTQNRFAFPPAFVLGPGEDVMITSGSGDFGFGMESPIWNNGGDTAFVVDDQGRFVTYLSVTGG
ncbi:MAG TPA: lamin tail domain-containing protein [Acidimicrobiia bacterium]|nr:lamin tail domain-containing protein [Acidimicrobiia bacterium]